MSTQGGSVHQPQDSTDEPKTFGIQILPAGSAPKSKTHQPNVGGELAPGQPNNTASTEFDGKKAPDSNVKEAGKEKDVDEDEEKRHQVEIKGASEMEPESAESL